MVAGGWGRKLVLFFSQLHAFQPRLKGSPKPGSGPWPNRKRSKVSPLILAWGAGKGILCVGVGMEKESLLFFVCFFPISSCPDPMKFCSGGGSNDIGSQMGDESFCWWGLWFQEHGERCTDFVLSSSHHLTLEAVTTVGGAQRSRETKPLPF